MSKADYDYINDKLNYNSGRVPKTYDKAEIDAKLSQQIDAGFLATSNLFSNVAIRLGVSWQGNLESPRAIEDIDIKALTQYTAKVSSLSNLDKIVIYETDAIGTITSSNIIAEHEINNTSEITFTTNTNTKYLRVMFISTASSITGSIVENAKLQIEKGNTVSSYIDGNGKSNKQITKELSGMRDVIKGKTNANNSSLSLEYPSGFDYTNTIVLCIGIKINNMIYWYNNTNELYCATTNNNILVVANNSAFYSKEIFVVLCKM